MPIRSFFLLYLCVSAAVADFITDKEELALIEKTAQYYAHRLKNYITKEGQHIDIQPQYKHFLKTEYKQVSITGAFDFEEAYIGYIMSKPTLKPNASFQESLIAYESATRFYYLLASREQKWDQHLQTITRMRSMIALTVGIEAWTQALLRQKDRDNTYHKAQNMSNAIIILIERLRKKTQLVNEVQSRKLFLEQYYPDFQSRL